MGASLQITGTANLTNGVYYVLTTTNIALPLTTWSRVATNITDGTGHFDVAVSVDATGKQRFYIMQLP